MRVVYHESVCLILLQAFIVEDLRGSNLLSELEAIPLARAIILAKRYHRVDSKRLPNHNLDVRVKLGHDQRLLLEVVQIHDDLILEVEFLALEAVDVLALDEVFQQVHKWAVIPMKITQTKI